MSGRVQFHGSTRETRGVHSCCCPTRPLRRENGAMEMPNDSDADDSSLSDPVAAARAARLRYVSDRRPGISRTREGDDFVFHDADGSPITDERTLDRIRKLAIPPAYTQVWICRDPRGHLQAVGRDARGRKQYRYHARWREIRDEAKYGKMLTFGRVLPAIRARVQATTWRCLDCRSARCSPPSSRIAGKDHDARRQRRIRQAEQELRPDHAAQPARQDQGQPSDLRLSRQARRSTITSTSNDRRLARVVERCRDSARPGPVPVPRP